MIVRIPAMAAMQIAVPRRSVRGHEPHTGFVLVDRRRFARSYRRWRKDGPCDFYNKPLQRLARFRTNEAR